MEVPRLRLRCHAGQKQVPAPRMMRDARDGSGVRFRPSAGGMAGRAGQPATHALTRGRE